MKNVLCIAGLDTSGGAGIAADIRASISKNTRCLPVITSIAAQNDNEVLEIEPVSEKILKKQLDAVIKEFEIGAVKIGLLHSPEIAEIVAEKLGDISAPVVLDPILSASSGGSLAKDDLKEIMVKSLFPKIALLTPNKTEAEALTGLEINKLDDAWKACRELQEAGPKAVLVKGGHLDSDDDMVTDVLFTGRGFHEFSSKRVDGNFRGTGCAYSTLIACHLADRIKVEHAVDRAKGDLHEALEEASANNTNILFGGVRSE